jgi:hypothetical protein
LSSISGSQKKKKVRDGFIKLLQINGKLTAFLQLQEFSQRNLPAFIAFAARLSFLG